MKASNALSTLRVVSIAFGMIVAFAIPTFGQEAPLQNEASAPAMNEVLRHNIENWALQGRGVPEDWSHHHLIFSNPGTEEDAIANGTHDRWLKIVNDPRYILQQMKRSSGVKALADPEIASLGQAAKTESIKKAKPKKGKLKKDWTQTLIAGGQVQPNMYPGKFSFSTTVASCSADFVVYPTGVAGATNAANIIAYSNLYATGCTGTVPSVLWAYNTGGMVTTSPIIAEGGSQVAFIQVTGTTASLVLLKTAASTTETLVAPDTLTVQGSASAYRNCTAPCFYTVSLSANDTYSAPFYDYLVDDAIYVGDDSGKLHKITGVFYGTTIARRPVGPCCLTLVTKPHRLSMTTPPGMSLWATRALSFMPWAQEACQYTARRATWGILLSTVLWSIPRRGRSTPLSPQIALPPAITASINSRRTLSPAPDRKWK